ncbi:hypothetical protein LX73_0640 [Fodinibius salinus]|uniref:PEGA domain-containing protein n=1 Tax=Fodinibius salinus TaxID=860790 RepID=A0A5D3YN52_9BACT|nr:hypothetical protein [Fodinibius salinus]TYP95340.1 hypothetical protein LX73_0640 [Fodinibius salinus]
MKRIISLCAFLILLSGCASDFYTNLQNESEGEEYGNLAVKLSEPVNGVNVTIDGELIARDKNTEYIKVDNVPVGERSVNVDATSSDLKSNINLEETVNIQTNETETLLVQVPPKSTGYWIYMSLALLPTLIIVY